jgi:4-hydroxybenzoate polyprenyltransferase
MSDYLKLVRIKNLLIIAATQYLMRYAVIIPILKYQGFEPQFSHLSFLFLVLTTVFLAAAGYVINDYFDTQTDILNKPESVIVGKTVKRQSAMTLHIMLNGIALVLAFYISYTIGFWKLTYIYILITVLLWLYSAWFKRQLLVGNIIVAFLTAMVPLLTVLYEIPPLNKAYGSTLLLLDMDFNILLYWILGFTIFAFLSNLIREIIKDIEDFEGDKAYGRRSLPVVAGIQTSKIVINSLIVLSILLLIFAWVFFIQNKLNLTILKIISASYITLAIILPFIILLLKTVKAKTKSDWTTASRLSKLIMLFGILFSLIIRFSYIAYT